MKHCTNCNSSNVRRSGTHATEASQHPFHSPYRCLECDTRFWVVSRKTRFGAAAGGAIALVLVLAVAVPSIIRMTGHPASVGMARPVGDAAAEAGTQRVVDDLLRSQSDYLTRQSQPLTSLAPDRR